mmetsp:Transcript_29826/g.102736  ORF Transcript_29826/g.102736 Transcript_29826/m.102736 type:complete len:284 (+) Transcript_29826:1241-2092(+)
MGIKSLPSSGPSQLSAENGPYKGAYNGHENGPASLQPRRAPKWSGERSKLVHRETVWPRQRCEQGRKGPWTRAPGQGTAPSSPSKRVARVAALFARTVDVGALVSSCGRRGLSAEPPRVGRVKCSRRGPLRHRLFGTLSSGPEASRPSSKDRGTRRIRPRGAAHGAIFSRKTGSKGRRLRGLCREEEGPSSRAFALRGPVSRAASSGFRAEFGARPRPSRLRGRTPREAAPLESRKCGATRKGPRTPLESPNTPLRHGSARKRCAESARAAPSPICATARKAS